MTPEEIYKDYLATMDLGYVERRERYNAWLKSMQDPIPNRTDRR